MRTDRSTTAFQGLIGDMRNYWAKDLYPAFAAHCRDRLGRDRLGHDRLGHDRLGRDRLADKPADSPDAIAGEMRDDTLYAYYAWLERHIQRMKYSHPAYGLKAAYGRLRPEIAAHLDGAAAAAGGMLELDPDLEIPQYYRDVDIHQHPGNLAGDIIDGYVYQASALSIHPNTKRFEVHDRFASLVRARGDFRRILDMGCGFGKSTTPLAREFPDAQVLGIELSAPCLKLAAVEGVELQLRNLAYRQADCLRSALPDERFDLVTSTQLLHELPVAEIHNVLAESFRLLQPGGQVLHLDFRSQGAFQGFLMAGHARRNNEGFMASFDRMDVAAAFARAGFTDYQEIPFAEREGATDPDYPYWRFPWMLFAARKP